MTSEDELLEAVASIDDQSSSAEITSFLQRVAGARLNLIAKRNLIDQLKTRIHGHKRGLGLGVLQQELSTFERNFPERRGPPWREHLDYDHSGEIRATARNILTALKNAPEWQGVLQLNEFQQLPWIRARPPWLWAGQAWTPGPFIDADEARTLVWMQDNGIQCQPQALRPALAIAFDDLRFHPVREYLDGLVWDRQPRLDQAPTYYFGVEPIANYTEYVFAKWMISAVARIYQPGCMVKYCLILEGPQDLKKSMALETLGSPWFTDDIATLGSKDSQLQVGNAWIVELAELDSIQKADISAIKAFVSRKVDRFRKPYGRNIVEQPRQSVLAGTINPTDGYLKDDTGNSRFWPLTCTAIDIDALAVDRDQLWAEAVCRYQAGEKWYLVEDDARQTALAEQERRTSPEVWFSTIADYLNETPQGLVQKRQRVTIEEILKEALNIKPGDTGFNRSSQIRIGYVLRQLKWRQDPKSGERPRPYFRP